MIKAVIFDFYGVLNDGMSPSEKLLEFIKTRLKPQYKLGIISNAADDFMYQIIPQEELKNTFDDVVVSHQVGVPKPESMIYQTGLKNLGVRADEAVFIDDIEVHCEGARAVGMQAILYKSFEQMKEELEKLLAVSNN